MLKFLFPIISLIAAVAVFYMYIDPTYQDIKELRAEAAQFDEALDRSRELQALRGDLLSKYNTFPTQDLERLQELLPNTVDNVRLILDIDNIASSYGMRIRQSQISASGDAERARGGAVGPDTRPYGTVRLSFAVSATYGDFRQFMEDLQNSLRVVDITSLSFQANDNTEFYDYRVEIRTYWLKDQ